MRRHATVGSRISDRLRAFGYWKNGRPEVLRFCAEKGYRPQYVYAWLTGRRPSERNLERLAADLQAPVAWLLLGDPAGSAPPAAAAPSGPSGRLEVVNLKELTEMAGRLIELEMRLDTAFRAFPDASLWWDADGRLTSYSAGHDPDLLGPPDALLGKSLHQVFPPDTATTLHAAFRRTLRTGALVVVEYSLSIRDDQRVYEARFTPLPSRPPTGPAVLQIVRDITDRKRTERTTRALANVGREIAATLDLDKTTHMIVSTIADLFHTQYATIYRLEEGTGRLVCVAAAGDVLLRNFVGRSLAAGEGVVGRAVAERRAIWTQDFLADPRISVPDWVREHALRSGYRSVVGVPLIARGEVIGALGLGGGPDRVFTEHDLALVSRFADQAAIALANAKLFQETRRFADELEVLNELNRLVSSSLDPDEVFGAIARAAAQLMGARAVTFSMADETAQTLTPRGFSGDRAVVDLPACTLRFGKGAPGWVAAHRQSLNIPDVFSDERIAYPEWWRRLGLQSYFGVPILHEGALLGVLSLLGEKLVHLGAAEQRLLECFVAQAATAIRNARLFAESEARRRMSESLAEVGHLLSETLDPVVVGQRIADSIKDLFSAQSSALYRLDPASGDLVGFAGSGDMGPAFRRDLAMPRGNGAVGLAVGERRPVATPNVLTDPRITLTAEVRARIEPAPYRSALAVPLMIRKTVIGALSIADVEGREFGPADVRLIRMFADQAAVALENARLYTETTRRWQEAEAVARVARTLTECPDVATVGERIVESVLPLFGVQSATVRLRRADGSFVVAACSGRARGYIAPGHVVPAGAALPGRVVTEGKAVASRDILEEPDVVLPEDLRRVIEHTGDRGTLAMPLRVRGQIMGVLIVADRAGRVFDDAEILLLETFADQAALALDNVRLHERQAGGAEGGSGGRPGDG